MKIKNLLLTLIVASISSQAVYAAKQASLASLRDIKAGEVVLEGKEAVIYLHDTNDDVVGAVRINVQGNR